MTKIKVKTGYIVIGLMTLWIISSIVSIMLGTANMSISEVLNVLLGKNPDAAYNIIIWNVRIPRIIASTIVGMALAASGAAMQALFRNPMADPYILGTSSGASLGIALATVLGLYSGSLGFGFVSIIGFAGALGATLLVMSLGRIAGRMSNTGILLAGIVVSSFFMAVISFLYVFNHDKIASIYLWTMGGFNGIGWNKIGIIVVPVALGCAYLIIKARELNAIVMGEEHAAGIGVDVDRFKWKAMIATALLVSLAVFAGGIIGFVGLIVPHIVRMIFGADHKRMVLLSTLTGGIFLLLCDTLSRTILQTGELPVGIITSLFGAPFFLIILKRTRPENMI